MTNNKNDKIVLFSLIGAIVLFLLSVSIFYPYLKYSSPKRAIRSFKTRICAEDQIFNPLIVCGPKVLPLLLRDVKDKDMKRRGYAIMAMGHIGDPLAIPYLIEILYDKSEDNFTRYDSFKSIAMINLSYAKKIAKNFSDKDIKYVSDFAIRLVDNNSLERMLKRRSRWEAIFDKHE